MKYSIYLVIIALLFASCSKSTDSTLTEQSIIIYNNYLETKPIAKSDGLYFLSQQNGYIFYSKVDSNGNFQNILDLNPYIPQGFSSTELNYKQLLYTSDSTFAIIFTASDTAKNTYVSIAKFNAGNSVQWQKRETIPDSLKAFISTVCNRDDGNINVLISNIPILNAKVGGFRIVRRTYSLTTGEFMGVKADSSEKNLVAMYNLPSKGAIGIISIQPMGPGSNIFYLMKINDTNLELSPALGIEAKGISAVYEHDNNYIISSYAGNSQTGILASLFEANLSTGVLWQTNLNTDYSLHVLDIEPTSGGYYLTGCELDGQQFEWTNPTIVESSEMYQAKIDLNGQVLNQKIWTIYGMLGTSIFERNDGTLLQLGSKYSFSTYLNTFVIKTNADFSVL